MGPVFSGGACSGQMLCQLPGRDPAAGGAASVVRHFTDQTVDSIRWLLCSILDTDYSEPDRLKEPSHGDRPLGYAGNGAAFL